MLRILALIALFLFTPREAAAAQVTVCGQEVQQIVTTAESTPEAYRKFLGIYTGYVGGACRAYMLDHIIPARDGYVLVSFRKIAQGTTWGDPQRQKNYFRVESPERLTYTYTAPTPGGCSTFELRFASRADGLLTCLGSGFSTATVPLARIGFGA